MILHLLVWKEELDRRFFHCHESQLHHLEEFETPMHFLNGLSLVLDAEGSMH